MQGMTLFDALDKYDSIYNDLRNIISSIDIPEREKELQIKRNKNDVVYTAFSGILLRVTSTKNNLYHIYEIPKPNKSILSELSSCNSILDYKETKTTLRFRYDENILDTIFNEMISDVYLRLRKNQPKSIVFGCCHLYEKCSDAKECINSNLSFAVGCAYKDNLEAGRIFYGKNANQHR